MRNYSSSNNLTYGGDDLCLFVEPAQDTGSGNTGPNVEFATSFEDDFGHSSDTELLFRCRICWKGFKHPMSLTLHKDLHTGQTKCPICHRIFSRSYDMRAHLLRIHKCSFSVDAKLNFRRWVLAFIHSPLVFLLLYKIQTLRQLIIVHPRKYPTGLYRYPRSELQEKLIDRNFTHHKATELIHYYMLY